jgi:hypothetical protein
VDFLDAWTTLDPLALVRLLAPAVAVALSVILPGRRPARVAALGVAVALPFVPGSGPWPVTAGWCALWLGVAWLAGRAEPRDDPAAPRAGGSIESGVVGLVLGLALAALVVAAVARADLVAAEDRFATVGVLLLGLGLVHLMLRRHARRATFSFATLGLALQGLESAARATQGPQAPPPGAALGATVIGVALAAAVAQARSLSAGSDRVSLAHDLHD